MYYGMTFEYNWKQSQEWVKEYLKTWDRMLEEWGAIKCGKQ